MVFDEDSFPAFKNNVIIPRLPLDHYPICRGMLGDKKTSFNDAKKTSVNNEKKKVSINDDKISTGSGNRKDSKGDNRKSSKGSRKSSKDKAEGKHSRDDAMSDDAMSDVGSDTSSDLDGFDENGNDSWRNILWRSFQDYGPPYKPYDEDTPPYALITECSDYNCKLYKVHGFLNMQLDPNDRDPDDLFYTAMHWCVRNCHFSALKLLHKAGANLNLLNELGMLS